MPKSTAPVVPVGVNTGFAPPPDFWKVTGYSAMPLAVMTGGFSLKVSPAATLKTTGLVTQMELSQLTAAVKLTKLVPLVGKVLSMVNGPALASGVTAALVKEILSMAAGGLFPAVLSLFQEKMSRIVAGLAQLPTTAGGRAIFAVCTEPPLNN